MAPDSTWTSATPMRSNQFDKTKAGTNREAKVSGPKFSEEIKSVFNGANVGDLYVFTAIQVRGNDGKVKTLDNQLAVEIK